MRTAALLVALAACLAAPLPAGAAPATPIHHLVVIFDENISFDHYFGTYPNAANPAGDPAFTAKSGTPAVNGLSGALLTANPNGVNPFRLNRSMSVTCDNNHGYTAEQQAFDGGAMDKFVPDTTCAGNTAMGYYDGNTVTALWNYAQQYTLSDNFFGTVFGPSTPGALNLISGNTHVPAGGASVIGDPDPLNDQCGNRNAGADISFGGAANIGTLLSTKGVTWGWFQGGFRPTSSDAGGALCQSKHANASGAMVNDYSAHHEPFQYYTATENPAHQAPASPATIGHDEAGVNHQYDLTDFTTALNTGNVPEVSFLKPVAAQDGHGGNSGPLDEQRFLVDTVNAIQASNIWPDTAIVIAYDDSDGWYDHQASPIVNSSDDAADALNGAGHCDGPGVAPPTAGGYLDRCGFGPRLPLLAISPFSRQNVVDHTQLDQTSILRFIENNWATGQIGDSSFDNIPAGKPGLESMFDFTPGDPAAPTLALDPATGNPPAAPPPADSDGDGIPDSSDVCPNASDLAAPRSPRDGCPAAPAPDTDGDGIPDTSDLCPSQSDLLLPRPSRNGCPINVPTAGNDVLTGDGKANVICGLLGNDLIKGLGGNDTLFGDACGVKSKPVRAAASGGNDTLIGGNGNDKLFGAGGNDRLDGGKGNDKLFGGSGNDKLTGGPGTNTYSGGSGNDTVNARNGKKETVDCGPGRKDVATVDRRDKVKGCERVHRARR